MEISFYNMNRTRSGDTETITIPSIKKKECQGYLDKICNCWEDLQEQKNKTGIGPSRMVIKGLDTSSLAKFKGYVKNQLNDLRKSKKKLEEERQSFITNLSQDLDTTFSSYPAQLDKLSGEIEKINYIYKSIML